MRIVIQRVSHASVTIEGDVKSAIQQGYLILFGVEESDTSEDVDWLVKKVSGLRVFDDENHVMNRSIMDINGEILVISQFTLFASYKKGNRPSWFRAWLHDTNSDGCTLLPLPRSSIREFFSINKVLYSPFTKSGVCMMRFR